MSSADNSHSLLILTGLKGAGKGENGSWLIKNNHFTLRLDIGALVRQTREQIATKSPEDAAKAGTSQLVGSEFIDPYVKGFMMDWKPNQKGKILDGYPRREEQAFSLLLWQCQNAEKLNLKVKIAVVMLESSEERARKNRHERGKELGREDDLNEESIRNGVREFHRYTIPAINRLRINGIPYAEISSETDIPKDDPGYKEKSIAVVGERVLAALRKIEFI